jgi:alpha-beta hydrolase superfamily lysophospholipase
MDEGGMFGRLADALAAAGLTALRFSFRGHGRSGGTPQGVTVAGEIPLEIDPQAVSFADGFSRALTDLLTRPIQVAVRARFGRTRP